ncbi:hypothetical protein Tco_0480006, partial [Tanacetum coccineum]
MVVMMTAVTMMMMAEWRWGCRGVAAEREGVAVVVGGGDGGAWRRVMVGI